MEERSWSLPEELRSHQAFREDLLNLLRLDTALLLPLRNAVGSLVPGSVRSDDAQRVAQTLNVDETRAMHYAFTLRFLAGHAVEQEMSPSDLIDEIAAFSDLSLDPEKKNALIEAISPTPNEARETRSRDAFAFGDTYLGSSTVPIFAQGDDGKLYAGLNCTITYRTGGGARKSISINGSSAEFREVGQRMLEAAADAERTAGTLRLEP